MSTNLPDAMVNKKSAFKGNTLLKRVGEKIALTEEHIKEFEKCMFDPIYFAQNYVYVVNIDKGKMIIDMYPYQEKMLNSLYEHNKSIVLSIRQSGKCVDKDTVIRVKNKKYNNGKAFNMKIGDFHDLAQIERFHKGSGKDISNLHFNAKWKI